MGERAGWIVAAAAVVAVAGAVAIGGAVYGDPSDAVASWAHHLQDEAAEVDDDGSLDGGDAGTTAAMLVVVASDDGHGSAFAVLSAFGDDPALLTVLPASLYDLLPGSGIFPLADSLAFGGAELAALAVENTMGIDIGPTVVIAASDLPALLTEEVAVDLPNPLLVAGEDGAAVRVAAEGDLLRSPDVVAQLFTERGSGDLLGFLERQVATWRGLLEHAASNRDLRDALTATAGNGSAAAALLSSAADMEVTLLPVGQTGTGESEGFEPRADEIAALVERRLGPVATWTGERARAEILNGNGLLTTTRYVAGILIAEGFRVVRTDNAEHFDFETTVVLAQGDANTDLGRRVVGLLGAGELRLESEAPSGIVDVSIIVGHDIPTGEG